MSNRLNIAAVIAFCFCAIAAVAESPKSSGDKNSYSLFKPTPSDQMRELSTDRPDVTESPYTVDAGHFQAEISLFEYTYDDEGGHTDAVSILPINLKVGLLNNVDLQFVVNPYVNVRTRTTGERGRRNHGFGETQLRLKVNLWGNDGGETALALMPFISFPSAADGLGPERVEGGLIIPLSVSLPWEFEMGTMLEIDFVRNSANRGYGVQLVHSVTVGHKLWGELGGYAEYVGMTPIDTGATYQAQMDFGLTYGIGENAQLDAGINVGITGAVDDFTVFMGVSFRM